MAKVGLLLTLSESADDATLKGVLETCRSSEKLTFQSLDSLELAVLENQACSTN